LLLAAGLLGVYALCDLGLRAVDDRLSGNLAHVAEMPGLFAQLADGQSGGAAGRTLFLGNSLTNNGVDPAAFGSATVKVTPDGTSFWDWQCIVERQLFAHPERKVDRVVMGTAWHLASDLTRADPSRLGAQFCSFGDIARPSSLGISTPGDVGEFIVARASRVYALRDTIRNRALDKFIPHYKRFASEQNAAGRNDDGPAAPGEAEVPYTGLTRLAAGLKARGTELVMVLMPIKRPYEADPALLALAARGELRLIDYRHLPAIESRHFMDDMHLGPEGRAVLTAHLARDLAADDNAR
jgi:hypothetical protein